MDKGRNWLLTLFSFPLEADPFFIQCSFSAATLASYPVQVQHARCFNQIGLLLTMLLCNGGKPARSRISTSVSSFQTTALVDWSGNGLLRQLETRPIMMQPRITLMIDLAANLSNSSILLVDHSILKYCHGDTLPKHRRVSGWTSYLLSETNRTWLKSRKVYSHKLESRLKSYKR
jgi:hypothetical protein